MSNGKTPPPPSANTRLMPGVRPAGGHQRPDKSDPEGTVMVVRSGLLPRVLSAKRPPLIQAPPPGIFQATMEDYISKHLKPESPLAKDIVAQFAGVGRAARRLSALQERPGLNESAEEVMGYLRGRLGSGFVEPLVGHIGRLEATAADIMEDLCEDGVKIGIVATNQGIYNGTFADEIEKLLVLLQRGWHEVSPQLASASPEYEAIDERNNSAQALTDFLAQALYARSFKVNQGAALIELSYHLIPFGLHEDTKLIQDLQGLGSGLSDTISQTDVDERGYPGVEEVLHRAFDRDLTALMGLEREERVEAMHRLKELFLTLTKYSLYNRERALVKPYLPTFENVKGKGRKLDQYDPSLAGVRELLKALHLALRLISGETRLRKYLKPLS